MITRLGKLNPRLNRVMKMLWLHPVLRMKNDKMGVSRLLFGDIRKCYEKYIRSAFSQGGEPDPSLLFVPYVGMEEGDLLFIEEKIREQVQFEHIIFQVSSAGLAAYCGEGSFGLMYLRKGEKSCNLGEYFDEYREDNAEFLPESDRETEPDAVEESPKNDAAEPVEVAAEEPMKQIPEPYKNVPGLDYEAGLTNSGSEDMLKQVLQMFCDTYDAKAEELQNYFNDGDWKNYTIKVHALKSSSRLVGFLDLGQDAEALEMAGKRGDIEFIAGHHALLMEKYQKACEAVGNLYEGRRDLPEIEKYVLDDAYDGLSDFVQTKDFELARMVLISLKEYRLPPEDDDRFHRIQTCLSRMDWDGILEIIKERQ